MNPTSPYPRANIILAYALCGGALGGLCLYLYLSFTSPDTPLSLQDLCELVYLGILYGTVPALLTGAWLATCRAQHNLAGLLTALFSGAVITALCSIVIFYRVDPRNFFILILLFMSLIGAASAFLLALIFLPRRSSA